MNPVINLTKVNIKLNLIVGFRPYTDLRYPFLNIKGTTNGQSSQTVLTHSSYLNLITEHIHHIFST